MNTIPYVGNCANRKVEIESLPSFCSRRKNAIFGQSGAGQLNLLVYLNKNGTRGYCTAIKEIGLINILINVIIQSYKLVKTSTREPSKLFPPANLTYQCTSTAQIAHGPVN